MTQVEQIQSEHDGLAVDGIHVEVGPLSGVEPMLLQSAFAQVALDYGMANALLVIDEVPLTAECRLCGPVAVDQALIRCPNCGNDDVRIVRGDEVRLQSVTIRCPDRQEQSV